MSVSRVRIQINGTWYTAALNSATGAYEVSVTAPASSHGQSGGYYNVTAEVTNSAGTVATYTGANFTGLQLVVQETAAPTVTLVSPAQGYLTAAKPTFTVDATDNGSGINASSIVVKLDGTTVTATRTAITNGYRLNYTPAANLAQGAHTLTVTARDNDGNTGSLTASWTVDTVAPTLTLSAPADGALLTSPEVTVSGTVSDATSGLGTVTVGGETVPVSGGAFSRVVTIPAEGDFPITVTAQDKAGNRSSVTRTVTYDAGAPVITVLSPAEGEVTNQTTLTTTGTVSETGTGLASFTINGVDVPVTDGAFSYDFTPVEGVQTITYQAADAAGQTATITRTITRDTVAPVVTITQPQDGVFLGTGAVTVAGTVEESGTGLVWVTVNGEDVPPGAAFETVLELADGQYTVPVAAMDAAGNRGDASVSFAVDTAPPLLDVTAPAAGYITARPLTVRGTASDAGSGLQGVTVNGEPVTVGEDGSFALELDPPEGPLTLTVTATDRVGGATTVTREITVDTLPPDLHLRPGPVLVDAETVTVAGLVADSAGAVTLTLDGQPVEVGPDGSFAVTLPLTVGENHAALTARDAAGLEAVRELYHIRLITDRQQADVDRLTALYAAGPLERWPAADVAWFNEASAAGTVRGAYTAADLNRVTAAAEYLHGRFDAAGYADGFGPVEVLHTDGSRDRRWRESDERELRRVEDYRRNVAAVTSVLTLPPGAPAMPGSVDRLLFGAANNMEARLLLTDDALLRLEAATWYSDEIFCGEV